MGSSTEPQQPLASGDLKGTHYTCGYTLAMLQGKKGFYWQAGQNVLCQDHPNLSRAHFKGEHVWKRTPLPKDNFEGISSSRHILTQQQRRWTSAKTKPVTVIHNRLPAQASMPVLRLRCWSWRWPLGPLSAMNGPLRSHLRLSGRCIILGAHGLYPTSQQKVHPLTTANLDIDLI